MGEVYYVGLQYFRLSRIGFDFHYWTKWNFRPSANSKMWVEIREQLPWLKLHWWRAPNSDPWSKQSWIGRRCPRIGLWMPDIRVGWYSHRGELQLERRGCRWFVSGLIAWNPRARDKGLWDVYEFDEHRMQWWDNKLTSPKMLRFRWPSEGGCPESWNWILMERGDRHTLRLTLATWTLVSPDSRSKSFNVSVANSASSPSMMNPAWYRYPVATATAKGIDIRQHMWNVDKTYPLKNRNQCFQLFRVDGFALGSEFIVNVLPSESHAPRDCPGTINPLYTSVFYVPDYFLVRAPRSIGPAWPALVRTVPNCLKPRTGPNRKKTGPGERPASILSPKSRPRLGFPYKTPRSASGSLKLTCTKSDTEK